MADFTVVPYEPQYADALRHICLVTGGAGDGADPTKEAYLLAMYCDAYLAQQSAFVLLDGDGVAQGYLLYAEDLAAHRAAMEPCLATIDQLGGFYGQMARGELAMYEEFAADYPAHLHVDILEACTGAGGGSLLMRALFAHLLARQVPGVMLGVAAGNTRAIAYYRKHGFEVLRETPYSLVMGRRLAP